MKFEFKKIKYFNFENYLSETLIKIIPLSYLENFEHYIEEAKKINIKSENIFTAFRHYENDLFKALKDETIAGVGLDVYDTEPLPQDHKLRFLPNALLLPHIGYVTAENYSKFYLQMIENLEGCMKNKPLRVIS